MGEKTVLIVGAGASGMMAAIMAARNGASVTLLEQNEKPGKKICATGNGRCNFTNRMLPADAYRGGDRKFIEKVQKEFSVQDTLDFFEEIGVYPVERNGCYYPRSMQASSVAELLAMEAARWGVRLKTNEKVTEIVHFKKRQKDGTCWKIVTDGWTYYAHALILANGSMASKISGSDGSGYELAKSLGHSLIKPLPALTALKCKGNVFAPCAGVRTEGKVTLLVNQKTQAWERGELQLTDYGISEIPVFQISRYAVRALDAGKKVSLMVDFFPEMDKQEFADFLKKRENHRSCQSERELLTGLFPDKLVRLLCKKKDLIKAVKEFELTVTGYMDYSFAQICSGGVDTREICPETMESQILPSLYLCGELVDVDGMCGGYNLQWAWSSGAAAGKSAAAALDGRRQI